MLSVSPFRIGFDPQERETKRRDEDENGIGGQKKSASLGLSHSIV